MHHCRYDVSPDDQRVHQDGEAQRESELLHHDHVREHQRAECSSHDQSADGDDRSRVNHGLMDRLVVRQALVSHVLAYAGGQQDVVIHSESQAYHQQDQRDQPHDLPSKDHGEHQMGHRQGPADAHQDRRHRPERDGVRLHDEEQHQDDQDDHQDLDLDELVPDDLRHLVHDRRAAGDPHVLHQPRVILLERVQCGCHGIDGLHGPCGHGGLMGRHGEADVVRTLGNRGIDDHLPAFGVVPSDDRSVAVGDEIDGGGPVLDDFLHRHLLGRTAFHVRLDHRPHRVSDVLCGGSVGGTGGHRQDRLRIRDSGAYRILDGSAPHERTVGVGDVPVRASVRLDYAVAQSIDLFRYASLLGPLVGPLQRPFVHPVSGVVSRDGDVRNGFVQLHHGVIGHDHALVRVLPDELHPLPGIPVLHGADHVIGGLRSHRDVCRGDGDQDGHDEDRLRMLQREPG